MNLFVISILSLIVLQLIGRGFLETLNLRHSEEELKKKGEGQGELRPMFDYTREKSRLFLIETIFFSLVMVLLLITPLLAIAFEAFMDFGRSGRIAEAGFVLAVGLVFFSLSLPFEGWRQFVIEAKYGFNKSSLKLWWADKAKGLLLAGVVALPLLIAIFAVVETLEKTWWIAAAGIVTAFQFTVVVFYPRLIMPLFNRFSPLPAGELRERLQTLAKKAVFTASKIEIMDSSRRSNHSNAFFSGFGRFRKIVLFDTLLAQLDIDEVESVLAHEIGHYKKGHIPKRLLWSISNTFFFFWLIYFCISSDWFYPAFGFSSEIQSLAPALILFSLYGGVFTFWLNPVFNFLSRRHEYEADDYAKEIIGSPKPLIGALAKLSEKNLSNLYPHPWYSAFFYSHPTKMEREKALLST